MVKKELTEAEIAESIPDLWQPLTESQRELLAQNFTIQKYKKNETIYCEGDPGLQAIQGCMPPRCFRTLRPSFPK